MIRLHVHNNNCKIWTDKKRTHFLFLEQFDRLLKTFLITNIYFYIKYVVIARWFLQTISQIVKIGVLVNFISQK